MTPDDPKEARPRAPNDDPSSTPTGRGAEGEVAADRHGPPTADGDAQTAPDASAVVEPEQPEARPRVAEVEGLLFLDAPDIDGDGVPDDFGDTPGEEPAKDSEFWLSDVLQVWSSGVVQSARHVMATLDPSEQAGSFEVPLTGVRLIPGLVPLPLVTLGSFAASCTALVASLAFASTYAPQYMFAFAVAHIVFFGHLWTYHVGFRTRRRLLVLREIFFVSVLMAFVEWTILDMIAHPPGLAHTAAKIADTYATYLWVAFFGNAVATSTVLLHWLVLGRGYREVRDVGGRRKQRRRLGAPHVPDHEGAVAGPH